MGCAEFCTVITALTLDSIEGNGIFFVYRAGSIFIKYKHCHKILLPLLFFVGFFLKGLANLYEKPNQADVKGDLADVYQKLLELYER